MENNERGFVYIDTTGNSVSKVNKNILHYAVKRYTSVAVRLDQRLTD
jgi:4-hydroxy-3-methylbut-2-enyl diphosphate reductase IspH